MQARADKSAWGYMDMRVGATCFEEAFHKDLSNRCWFAAGALLQGIWDEDILHVALFNLQSNLMISPQGACIAACQLQKSTKVEWNILKFVYRGVNFVLLAVVPETWKLK